MEKDLIGKSNHIGMDLCPYANIFVLYTIKDAKVNGMYVYIKYEVSVSDRNTGGIEKFEDLETYLMLNDQREVNYLELGMYVMNFVKANSKLYVDTFNRMNDINRINLEYAIMNMVNNYNYMAKMNSINYGYSIQSIPIQNPVNMLR